MTQPRKRGSFSVMIRVFIPNSSSTTGAGLTGLTNSSTNLTIATIRELSSSSTVYTGANIEAQTTPGAFQSPSSSSKVRFKEVDATNQAGVYEIQFSDGSLNFGTGDTSKSILINVFENGTTALNMGPCKTLVPLTPWDYQDGNLGLTGLAGLTAPTAGALITKGTGTNQLNVTGGAADTNMAQAVPTSNTANTSGDCLNAARAQGFGKWTLSGTTLTLYASDGTTAVRTFTLDSATTPTSRT